MEELRLLMLLMLGIGVLQLSCAGGEDLDARSIRKCKNPNGKIHQLKKLGCKSAVCSKGEGGKMFWKECRQPAKEEKQDAFIDIQTATQEKVNEINNKQTRVLESQSRMIDIQNKTQEKVDQINNKQTRVIERQDRTIDIQNATQEKVDQINNKQTRVIERQDKMIDIQNATQEKVDQINNKQTRVIERQDKIIDIQTATQEKVDQINNKQTRVIERQDKMISLLERICGPFCSVPVVFQKTEEFTIRRNNMLGELSVLRRQFIITFQLFVTAPTFSNIIQFTIGGDSKYGSRVPAILIYDTAEVGVRSAINGNRDYLAPLKTPPIALNTWHNIEVSQLAFENEVYFFSKIDGTTFFNVKNTDAREFKNVKMYAGNPWSTPCSGKIRHFEVKTMA